jgi:Flp pilus assembly pilin Flp
MNTLLKTYIRVREGFNRFHKGQTMTEYAMIMAAIAVVVFATYQILGNNVKTLVNSVATDV